MKSNILKQIKEKGITPLDLIFFCHLNADVAELILENGSPLDWTTAEYLRSRGIHV